MTLCLSKVNARELRPKIILLKTKLIQADKIMKSIIWYVYYFKFFIKTQDTFLKEGIKDRVDTVQLK